MSDRVLPNDSVHDVITFDILSDGKVVDQAYQVQSISVSKEVNRIPTAKIVLRDGDASEETFELSNGEEFIPGKKIVIKTGRDSKNEVIFKGIVIRHSIKIGTGGESNLIVECRDESVRMTIGRHSKYFEKRKDSQVMEELIGAYSGLKKEVEKTILEHKELVQYHATDWDFMCSRADVNGRLVIVDDGVISIKKPDTKQASILSLQYGDTIYAFEAEMDARTQWKSVKGEAWDYANQTLFEADGKNPAIKEAGNLKGNKLAEITSPKVFKLQHSGQLLKSELQAWTDAAMLKSRLAKIRGRAHIIVGNSELKPGKVIEVKGVGNRFNGNVFITAIRHDIAEGTWDTHIQFGLNPKWFAKEEGICDFPAAGLIPAIQGLQIGKVVQLENDPDGEDRILVKLPIIDPNASGIWMRIASLDAGNNRGAFFRPEIDDEVIVGFINEDPRDAVVLGMLNSSKHPAPIKAKDTNHEKAFVTRENMRIHFHDETKTITIDTPAGNSITIDEDSKSIKVVDQNDNEINMTPSGIELKSPKEVIVDAGTNMTLKASANMVLEATNISIKASGPLEAKGAMSKLSASGITEIAGSLVKIN